MGMKVTYIHTIYRFKQSPWLAKCIDHNTQKHTKAKTNFEKDLYKLMNNAFFGKTMESVKDRVKLEFIDHSQTQQITKRQSKLISKVLWIGTVCLVCTSLIKEKQSLINQFIYFLQF